MDFYDILLAKKLDGGGGGEGGITSTDAILRVQAPAGSVVTISKGSTEKTDEGHINADDNTKYDYYFIIHQSQFDSVNPWNVTAVLGTKTSTKTIVVDSSNEYDLVIVYGLPDEYQMVEYLEATGNKYIITDWAPDEGWLTGKIHYEIDFQTQVNSRSHPAGVYQNVSGNVYNYLYQVDHNGTNLFLWMGRQNFTSAGVSYYTRYKLEADSMGSSMTVRKNGVIVDTKTIDSNYVTGYEYPVFSERNTNQTPANFYKGRIYSVIITKNGTDELNLIPCYRKSDSVAGMYDTVSENFYTGVGTGTFVVGGDV